MVTSRASHKRKTLIPTNTPKHFTRVPRKSRLTAIAIHQLPNTLPMETPVHNPHSSRAVEAAATSSPIR
jgi:hypothetical protein